MYTISNQSPSWCLPVTLIGRINAISVFPVKICRHSTRVLEKICWDPTRLIDKIRRDPRFILRIFLIWDPIQLSVYQCQYGHCPSILSSNNHVILVTLLDFRTNHDTPNPFIILILTKTICRRTNMDYLPRVSPRLINFIIIVKRSMSSLVSLTSTRSFVFFFLASAVFHYSMTYTTNFSKLFPILF